MTRPLRAVRARRPTAEAGNHAAMDAAGLRFFFGLGQDLGLTVEQQRTLLGGVSNSTFHRWREAPEAVVLSHDVRERLSYLVGIWKALVILLGSGERALAWLHAPNTGAPFGGQPAIERLLQGNITDLADVRRYLDAWRA